MQKNGKEQKSSKSVSHTTYHSAKENGVKKTASKVSFFKQYRHNAKASTSRPKSSKHKPNSVIDESGKRQHHDPADHGPSSSPKKASATDKHQEKLEHPLVAEFSGEISTTNTLSKPTNLTTPRNNPRVQNHCPHKNPKQNRRKPPTPPRKTTQSISPIQPKPPPWRF